MAGDPGALSIQKSVWKGKVAAWGTMVDFEVGVDARSDDDSHPLPFCAGSGS